MVQESTNTFSDGLISDLNPLTTPNTVLTDALNATLLTFNGNELVLQNDMGNAKIEGCKLSEGFIPLGIKEHGGILYIVSTNGEETEIGSFPSPKATTVQTIPLQANIVIDGTDSQNTLNRNIKLSNVRLNPGDKFIIFLNINDLTAISSFTNRKFYKLKLLSIENGLETEITNTLISQDQYISDNNFSTSDYWFVPTVYPTDEILANYILNNKTQVYKLRKAGKLYLRVEIENIDDLRIKNTTNPSSIYPILQITNENNVVDGKFYLNFNVYIKALSEIKADSIIINYSIIDLKGISADINSSKTVSFADFTGNTYQRDNILIEVGSSNDVVVAYKITCKNANYGIDFKDFIVKDVIDLSIDPSQWANFSDLDYEFYDYDLFDYQTI